MCIARAILIKKFSRFKRGIFGFQGGSVWFYACRFRLENFWCLQKKTNGTGCDSFGMTLSGSDLYGTIRYGIVYGTIRYEFDFPRHKNSMRHDVTASGMIRHSHMTTTCSDENHIARDAARQILPKSNFPPPDPATIIRLDTTMSDTIIIPFITTRSDAKFISTDALSRAYLEAWFRFNFSSKVKKMKNNHS